MTGGTLHFQANNEIINNDDKATNNEKRSVDDATLRFCLMPSIRATLANRWPQNAVQARQTKHTQDSIADAEIVPAPPSTRETDVTINSARNKIPPELPTIWPIMKKAMTVVFMEKRVKIDLWFGKHS